MAQPNVAFKQLYLNMKKNPLFKNTVNIPEFEKSQQGGYRKGYKLVTQEDKERVFTLSAFAANKNGSIDMDNRADYEIVYELDDEDSFGRFENIKPREAAKKIYTRLCKLSRKDVKAAGSTMADCKDTLLRIKEYGNSNVKKNGKVREYYYYIINKPNKRKVKLSKSNKEFEILNDIKIVPIFAVRNNSNEIERYQTINEAIKNQEKKSKKSVSVYASRKSSGKRLLKNAK